jgi:NTP pyrophosphatase (non-canonical NTP hydrolase)
MEFNHYQKEATQSAIYPNKGNNFLYPALGLAGETGEVCEKIKKVLRDKAGVLDYNDIKAITLELGDVLWYISALAGEIGISLDTVAENNLIKLGSRKDRGVLGGSGDER